MAAIQTITSTDKIDVTRIDANGVGTKDSITLGALFASGMGHQPGYGAGSTVTQATSRTTGVTINALAGSITMVSAAGSTTAATFTVTNNKVAVNDCVVVTQRSGTDPYRLEVTNTANGSFQITFNTVSGITTEQPVFNFVVIKGAVT